MNLWVFFKIEFSTYELQISKFIQKFSNNCQFLKYNQLLQISKFQILSRWTKLNYPNEIFAPNLLLPQLLAQGGIYTRKYVKKSVLPKVESSFAVSCLCEKLKSQISNAKKYQIKIADVLVLNALTE